MWANFRFRNLINNTVRKPLSLASATIISIRVPGFRKFPNSFESSQRFDKELITQPGRFSVVIFDRFVKLVLRDVEEPNLHLLAVFCEDFL